MLADMVDMMTERLETNCHWVNFKNSRKTRLCNIAKRALLVFPLHTKEPDTMFIATFHNDGPSSGKFVCDHALQRNIFDHWRDNYLDGFAATVGARREEVYGHVACQYVDECWGPDSWRSCVTPY